MEKFKDALYHLFSKHQWAIFYISIHFNAWLRKLSKPVIYVCNENENDQTVSKSNISIHDVIKSCPTLYNTYYPALLFFNGHLQLLPLVINSYFHANYFHYNWITEYALMGDGETICLDWVDEIPEYSSSESAPFLIILHGAFGNSRDIPGQQYYIGEAIKRGWSVCVFNRRGHNKPLCKSKFNFFGSTADLRHTIEFYLKRKRPKALVFMLGSSAGSGLLARYLGEQGLLFSEASDNKTMVPGFCDAAVGICPGYNIEKCMDRFQPIMGIKIYEQMLLDSAKTFFMLNNKEVLQDSPHYQTCLSAEGLQQWLDLSYAFGGYESAKDYYDACNPMRVVHHIKQPTLIINSEDDPICVFDNVLEHLHLFQKPLNVAIVSTKSGSHCSFFEFNLNPFKYTSWAERATFEFFDSFVNQTSHKV